MIVVLLLFFNKKISKKLGVVIIIAGVLPYLFLEDVKDFQEETARVAAIELIKEIDLYENNEGEYPENLYQLRPKYSNNLPFYWIRMYPKKFIYEVYKDDSEGGYGLHYYVFGQGVMSYNGKTKEWFFND